ncbi:DUF3618 domain-containing protein [Cellulomonas endophytica]|uniref:DUF3618 domain-containing protein n=1 Tax=Cellulomonas endophytica TaxID=2494735 RepID=UPI001011000A|nr:DUF3618 domain-containing protein [Cellulomonas endophytica]
MGTEDSFATPRTVALEAELAATRRQLAETVDELADRLDPRANAQKVVEGGRRYVDEGRRLVQDVVSGEASADERNRVLAVAGGVVGAVVLLVTIGLRRR